VEYLAYKSGAWNLFDANWVEESAAQILCNHFEGICDGLIAWLADSDTSVDNLDRYDIFLKDFPAGSGYQNIVYYAQTI